MREGDKTSVYWSATIFWNRCSIMIFLMAYALCYIPHSGTCMFVLRTVRAFTLYDKAARRSQLC
jgi:hypothetical protein